LKNEKLAILDCGGQYTKSIDRKIRELGVKSDIFPMNVSHKELADYTAIILSGGPAPISSSDAPAFDENIFDLGLPMLGICYGMRLINDHFGGKSESQEKIGSGQRTIKITEACPIFAGLDKEQAVLIGHADSVIKLAQGFYVIAKADDIAAAICSPQRKIVGLQFHPEVELSENGTRMLENFLRRVCAFKETYALEDRIETSVKMIRERVGNNNVISLVSGGVDSAVTTALLLKALDSDKVWAIHVDHGLMRLKESESIINNLKKLGLKHLQKIDAEEIFFNTPVDIGDGVTAGPLCKVCDPEFKRNIIGSIFIKVAYDAISSLGLDTDKTFIAQGTLRPDLIESGNPEVSAYANKIKTHHNDVDIVRQARAKGLIIETNWDWHKDEVRQVARMLGLDEEIASRQPFPGPGLGVRLICNDRPVPVEQANIDGLERYMADKNYKALIAPIASVGVHNDARSYKSLALIYARQETNDWMQLRSLVADIPNKLNFINRCAILVSGHDINLPILCNPMHICHDTAELLRHADAIVTSNLSGKKISQCFAILVPIAQSGAAAQYSIAIRAVVTSDFMTARPAIPGEDFETAALYKITEAIKDTLPQIDMVFYDLTGKPPATVEWE